MTIAPSFPEQREVGNPVGQALQEVAGVRRRRRVKEEDQEGRRRQEQWRKWLGIVWLFKQQQQFLRFRGREKEIVEKVEEKQL